MYLAEEWEYVDDNLSIFEVSSGHHTLGWNSAQAAMVSMIQSTKYEVWV